MALIGKCSPEIFPETRAPLLRDGGPRTGHGHRPDLGGMIRSTAICRSAGGVADWRAKQGRVTRLPSRRAARAKHEGACRLAMVDFWNEGVPTLDYGNNIRQVAKEEGLENAFAFPRLRCRPISVRSSAVGVGPFRWCAALGRPGGYLQDRCEDEGALPRERTSASLARHGSRAHRPSRGLPARIKCGSGSATGTGRGSPSTRWCATAN